MKTPKRYLNKPLPLMPEDSTVDDFVIDIWSQRAKRKNKEAQLKRTIARLKKKNSKLKERLKVIKFAVTLACDPDIKKITIKWNSRIGEKRKRQEKRRAERLERKAARRACHPETATGGQQTTGKETE